MAWDNVVIEYHLTPQGWKDGNSWSGASRDNPSERPPGTVLTVRQHIYQRSSWSQEEITETKYWRSPTASRRLIENLIKRFGGSPSTKQPAK